MWRFPCGNMFIVQNTTKNHFLDRFSFRSKWVGETDFIGPWKYFRDHWIYNSQLFQEIQFSFALRWLYANTLKYLHTAASIPFIPTSHLIVNGIWDILQMSASAARDIGGKLKHIWLQERDLFGKGELSLSVYLSTLFSWILNLPEAWGHPLEVLMTISGKIQLKSL